MKINKLKMGAKKIKVQKFKSWIGKLPEPRRTEMKKWWESQELQAAKFKMSAEDLHNLLDLFYMCVDNDDYDTFKLNKLDKWYGKFFAKVEKNCMPELY